MKLFKALIGATGLEDSVSNTVGGLATELAGVFKSVMSIAMPIVFSVVTALGVFFAVKLGIEYAKTEKTEQREEAKKRLIGAIVGFGIGIVAAAVMWFLFTNNTIVNALFPAGE